jgi:hypothetical protein
MLPPEGFAEYPSTNLAAFPNHPSTRILPHATRRHGFYHKPPGDFLLWGRNRVAGAQSAARQTHWIGAAGGCISGPRKAVLRIMRLQLFNRLRA